MPGKPSHQAYRQAKGARSRAKRAGVVNALTKHEWRAQLDLADGRCQRCGEVVGRRGLTLDHVVPLADGGPNVVANVAPVCAPCNAKNRPVSSFARRQLAG